MMKTKSPIIEQVFLIYRDGRLISYASINMDDDFDEDIMGGMLLSVMKFISYAFGDMDKEKTDTDEYKFVFGKRGLLLEMGENFFIAIVVQGTGYDSLLSKTRAIVRDIEEEYNSVLEDWSGELDDFKGVDDIIIKLLPWDELSESQRKAIQKGGIKEIVFRLWSSRYDSLFQKSLMPGSSLLKSLKLDVKPDNKKKSSKKIEKTSGQNESK